jgi:hypothetical protein
LAPRAVSNHRSTQSPVESARDSTIRHRERSRPPDLSMEGTSSRRWGFALRGAALCPRFCTRSIVPAVLLSGLSFGTSSEGARFADFREGNLLDARRVRSPAKGGECPVFFEGNFEGAGPRGDHLQRGCRRDGQVSSIASASAPKRQKRVRLRDVKIVRGVVRDRSAWFVGCLRTRRTSWATTKGVECRCVQLVCPCGQGPIDTGTS